MTLNRTDVVKYQIMWGKVITNDGQEEEREVFIDVFWGIEEGLYEQHQGFD